MQVSVARGLPFPQQFAPRKKRFVKMPSRNFLGSRIFFREGEMIIFVTDHEIMNAFCGEFLQRTAVRGVSAKRRRITDYFLWKMKCWIREIARFAKMRVKIGSDRGVGRNVFADPCDHLAAIVGAKRAIIFHKTRRIPAERNEQQNRGGNF